ncbi:GNAT family N-acetyltransferase [Streptomyces sp. NPDC005071]
MPTWSATCCRWLGSLVPRPWPTCSEVVAAAGYRAWPRRTAHISVLTAPGWRGRGLARVTGSATTTHALAAGLLPQWRARVPESRRVAIALGFRELGAQLSIDLA